MIRAVKTHKLYPITLEIIKAKDTPTKKITNYLSLAQNSLLKYFFNFHYPLTSPFAFSNLSSSVNTKISYSVSNYWKISIFPYIQKQAQIVIQSMTEQKFNERNAIQKLLDYLVFGNQTFYQTRTPLGCIAVLAAMHASKNSTIMTYASRIVDFVSSFQSTIDHLDQNMLFCYLKSHQQRQNEQFSKNKRAYYRQKFAFIAKQYFYLVRDQHLQMFVQEINEVLQQQKYNIISFMRYGQLLDRIQDRVSQLIQEYLYLTIAKNSNNSNAKRKYQIGSLLNSRFLNFYIKVCKKLNFKNQKTATLLFRYWEIFISSNKQLSFYFQFSRIFIYTPYIYLTEYKSTLKQLLFETFQNKYKKSQIVRNSYQKNLPRYKSPVLHHYYIDVLSKTFQNLNFVNIDDQFNVIYRNQFKKPIFNQFFWKLIKNDEKNQMATKNLALIINEVYPQRNMKIQVNLDFTHKFHGASLSNEMTVRTEKVLKMMSETYEKEVEIKVRKVDFYLPNDKIILQIDGDYHINNRTMELNTQTSCRNMQFLLHGYKLIVLNVHEYNMNRQIDQLYSLLKKKIQLIKNNDIIYVQ